MVMDKMDGTGEQGQRGVHALACAVAFSSPFWFLERPLICEFVRLYANILAYFGKKYFFPGVVAVDYGHTMGGGCVRNGVEEYWRIGEWKQAEMG